MPGEYTYVNEATIWQPVMVAYAILIAGTSLLILATLSYLLGKFKRVIPLALLSGASMFLSVLLGPLADLTQPSRAISLFLNPHIFPSSEHPGTSLIAFYGGILWPVGALFTLIFGLLYFSYPMYLRSQDGGKLGFLYKILSLGVKSEEGYSKLSVVTKFFAVLLLLSMLPWTVYPGLLFAAQTYSFVWANWGLLPIINFVENFVLAFSILICLHYLYYFGKLDKEFVNPLNQLLLLTSLSLLGLFGLQVTLWGYRYAYSDFYQAFSAVLPPIYMIMGLLFIVSVISLLALKNPNLSIIGSSLGILAVLISKWNVVIYGQLASKTGLGLLELEFHGNWLLVFLAPLAFATLLFIIFTYIFPLEVGEK